jgi:lipopolysaccharide export system permease protein
MTIIARFLTRMILIRFAVIVLGIGGFVLTLEVVSLIKDMGVISPNIVVAAAKYCFMRAPSILTLFIPISLLLALLLTITELSYRSEMTAIWTIGVSPARLIVMLLPVALVVGGFQFVLMDQAVPAAAPILRTWGIGDYARQKFNTRKDDPVWLRSGDDIIRALDANEEDTRLKNLILFRRTPQGMLKEQIFAASGEFVDGQWQLKDVAIYYVGGQPPARLASMIYKGPAKPASADRSAEPEDMTMSALSYYIANSGFGVKPVYVYQTWWYKRLTPIIIAVVMLVLCVPLSTRFRRGGGIGYLFGFGVALGFLFFVGEGLSTTLGEVGVIAPWLAAFSPIIIFGAVAAAVLARSEMA